MKKSSVSCTQRSTYFQILYYALERWTRTHNQTLHGKTDWRKSSPEYRALDGIDGESMEFECNIFPRFTTLQLCSKIQELLSRLSVEPEKFTGQIIFMSMFNDISWRSKDNNKNANQVLSSFLCMRRDFQQDNGHSSDLDQKRNGLLLMKTVHKENGTELQSRWC